MDYAEIPNLTHKQLKQLVIRLVQAFKLSTFNFDSSSLAQLKTYIKETKLLVRRRIFYTEKRNERRIKSKVTPNIEGSPSMTDLDPQIESFDAKKLRAFIRGFLEEVGLFNYKMVLTYSSSKLHAFVVRNQYYEMMEMIEQEMKEPTEKKAKEKEKKAKRPRVVSDIQKGKQQLAEEKFLFEKEKFKLLQEQNEKKLELELKERDQRLLGHAHFQLLI